MNNQREDMWSVLSQSGIVQGEAPEPESTDSPWYIKLLLAVSGWLAALFLLGFIGVAFGMVVLKPFFAVLIGGGMIGAAFALLRIPKNEFYEHVALAVSLAGQALIVWAILDDANGSGARWLLVSIFQFALAVVIPNYIHRVLSSLFAASCLSIASTLFGINYIADSMIMLAAAWLWLHEFDYPKQASKQRAIGYGLVLAMVQIKGFAAYRYGLIDWFIHRHATNTFIQPWMGELIAGAVTLYIVWQILRRLGHGVTEPISIAALTGAAILAAASMQAHGVTVGMLIILLGFAGSNRVLMGLGIISLLFYISSYYYLLHATLLEKSQTLLLIGMVLFVVRWVMLRMTSRDEEMQHG